MGVVDDRLMAIRKGETKEAYYKRRKQLWLAWKNVPGNLEKFRSKGRATYKRLMKNAKYKKHYQKISKLARKKFNAKTQEFKITNPIHFAVKTRLGNLRVGYGLKENEVFDLLVLQNNSCSSCGQFIHVLSATVDHILPKTRGGSEDKENLQFLCITCNMIKRSMTMNEFISHCTRISEHNKSSVVDQVHVHPQTFSDRCKFVDLPVGMVSFLSTRTEGHA